MSHSKKLYNVVVSRGVVLDSPRSLLHWCQYDSQYLMYTGSTRTRNMRASLLDQHCFLATYLSALLIFTVSASRRERLLPLPLVVPTMPQDSSKMTAVQVLSFLDAYQQTLDEACCHSRDCQWNLTKARHSKGGGLLSQLVATSVRQELRPRAVLVREEPELKDEKFSKSEVVAPFVIVDPIEEEAKRKVGH